MASDLVKAYKHGDERTADKIINENGLKNINGQADAEALLQNSNAALAEAAAQAQ